ncbi:MAG: hypothetical protein KAS92_07615 [Candidatus Omnitrophica bacterium]|nr:hypothetical protein [Candidatus Omnitrophota bacterium]
MRKTLIILAAIILLMPLSASAYEGRGGHKRNKSRKGPKNEFRQAIKSKIQDHRQQQESENKDFRKTMQNPDLSQDQRIVAIKDHRQTRHQENVAFHKQIHQEGLEHISSKLAGNERLTDEQRQTIVNHRETQYQENVTFRDQQNSESMSAIDRILGNTNLTPDERKTQMKEYRGAQKKENQAYRKTQRAENREFRQSFRPNRPNQLME